MSEQAELLLGLNRRATEISADYRHRYVTVDHLLIALFENDAIANAVGKQVDLDPIVANIKRYLSSGALEECIQRRSPAPDYEIVFYRAAADIKIRGKCEPLDVLGIVLSSASTTGVSICTRMKLTSQLVEVARKKAAPAAAPKKGDVVSRAEAIKFIAQYATNLNERALASKIDPMIGRETEVAEMIQIFARKKKNNPILLGEAGVGKTAIVEGMAKMIAEGNVPSVMKKCVIWSVDLGALVAGTRYRGDFEERIGGLIKAVNAMPEAILYFDETHLVLGAGAASGSMDAAQLLKPALASGEIRMVGSTTLAEYRKYIEKDKALDRRFGRVVVEEPSIEDAKAIIHGLAETYSEFHGVTYTEEALNAAVTLTAKFIHSGQLPDKAIDMLDMAGAKLAVDDAATDKVVTLAMIEAQVSAKAKIPQSAISEDEISNLGSLKAELLAQVYGQDHAISRLVDSVFIARAGLRESDKTQGSFIFTGPTGVGKTEVAKQLAKSLHIPLVRFDMSEYMEAHSVSKLIGAPAGYVGFEDEGGSGLLTNAIDKSPSCVLLIDEVEKAHPMILNIFLQVMDNGMLTNSGGKAVSFRNVWLIFTSNAGVSEGSKREIGFGGQNSSFNSDASEAAIKKYFAPEFLNRLDARMGFNPLGSEQVRRVAEKFLADIQTMVGDRELSLDVTDAAFDLFAKLGYVPEMGARPMKRVIDSNVKTPLSRMIVLGEVKAGGKVVIDAQDGQVIVSAKTEDDVVA